MLSGWADDVILTLGHRDWFRARHVFQKEGDGSGREVHMASSRRGYTASRTDTWTDRGHHAYMCKDRALKVFTELWYSYP